MRLKTAGLVALLVVLVATPALAHVPSFPDDNTTPERAVEVPDPVKSWSFYDQLDQGQVRYYRFSLLPGERLRVGAFTPEDSQFSPSVVLMSPSLNERDPVPAGVTVPEGVGAELIEGTRPASASYELFAPSASYHTADIDRPVDGYRTYLVAVYEPANRSGKLGVTIGYTESFSPTEYVTVPFDLVQTHLWAGQHPLVAVGPFAFAVVGGAVALSRRRSDWRARPVRVGLAGAGLLIAATGVNTAVQTVLALAETGPTAGALVTAVFVVVPLLCGGWGIRVALRDGGLARVTRVGLVVAGAVSLLSWAGFIAGPVVLVGLAVVPNRFVAE
jgi:hypothetical protein